MPLAKFAVLAVACTGCTVYEAPTTPSTSGMPETGTPSTAADSAPSPLLDASSTSQDVLIAPRRCRSRKRPVTPDTAAVTDARTPTPDASAVDAGCRLFQPEARGDGSVVVGSGPLEIRRRCGHPSRGCYGSLLHRNAARGCDVGAGENWTEWPRCRLADHGIHGCPGGGVGHDQALHRDRVGDVSTGRHLQTVLAIDGKSSKPSSCKSTTATSRSARAADNGSLASLHVLSSAAPANQCLVPPGAVYDGANMILYVNGVLQNTLPLCRLLGGLWSHGRGTW